MAIVPYNAQLQVIFVKPVALDQAAPDGGRSMYYDPTLNKWRAFENTAEVLAYLPQAKHRVGCFPIYINIGGVLNGDGTFTGGTVTEYWFRDGVTNGDLVAKESGGGADGVIRRYAAQLPNNVNVIQNNQWIGATFISGTRSNGDIYLDTEVPDGTVDDAIFTFDSIGGSMTSATQMAAGERIKFILKTTA